MVSIAEKFSESRKTSFVQAAPMKKTTKTTTTTTTPLPFERMQRPSQHPTYQYGVTTPPVSLLLMFWFVPWRRTTSYSHTVTTSSSLSCALTKKHVS
jgi:hypothetical protein